MYFVKQRKLLLLLILLLAAFFRFYNLNWDSGHYLHPDERLYVNAQNISFPKTMDEFLSTNSPFNPHMFYYGPFPLYIYKLFNLLIPSPFVISSRFVSALLSFFTIPLIFLTGKSLFSKKAGFIAAFLFAFSTGSIQHAHFLTTESWLTFFLTFITYLSIKIVKHEKYYLFNILAILCAISYSIKITGLIFVFIPLLAMVILLFKKKNFKKFYLYILSFPVIFAFFALILAPYQIIDFASFQREQEYMQGVTYGVYKPPFAIIYENTLPYIYPLINILPFTFGFIALPLSLIGFFILIRDFIVDKKRDYVWLFVILLPVLYFLWCGMWFAKFSRYYILLFPFLAIWAGFGFQRINKYLLNFLLILIFLNGLFYLRVYSNENTRIEGSKWIFYNIQPGSAIASEHWDDSLPVPLNNLSGSIYNNITLAVYDQDSPEKIKILSDNLSRSDYFIISSRRVFYSILKNQASYPYTVNFYNKLFNEELGFTKTVQFTNYPFIINDDIADETFQSYDHPPVYIFKNEKKLTSQIIEALILEK